MSGCQVDFDYSIGQQIRVLPIDADGTVNSLWVSDKGKKYECVWWINGDRKSEYLFPHEISPKEKGPA